MLEIHHILYSLQIPAVKEAEAANVELPPEAIDTPTNTSAEADSTVAMVEKDGDVDPGDLAAPDVKKDPEESAGIAPVKPRSQKSKAKGQRKQLHVPSKIVVLHCDIIKDEFWDVRPGVVAE